MNKNLSYTCMVFFSVVMIATLVGCSALPAVQAGQPLTASGTIQSDSIRLSAEWTGRINEIKYNQGDLVKAGEVVFRLDDAAFQIQRKQAQAALQAAQVAQAAAQADLDLLKAGPTADQIRVAQAQLDQASADLKAIQSTLWDAQGSSRPEEIDIAHSTLELARRSYFTLSVALPSQQIEDTDAVLNQAQDSLSVLQARRDRLAQDSRTPRTALDALDSAIKSASDLVDAAREADQAVQDSHQPLHLQIAALRKTQSLSQLNLSQAQSLQTAVRSEMDMSQEGLDAAQLIVNEARACADRATKALDGLNNSSQAAQLTSAWDELQKAQQTLNALGRLSAGSVDLETLLNQQSAATARRAAAEATLNNLKNGSRPEQIAAAQAAVDLARARVAEAQTALDLLDMQIGKLAVASPLEGIVLSRSFDPGEVVPAGAAVMEIGSLDTLTLKVYIPEDQYGKVKLGQAVSVKVDSFPGRLFSGSVSKISDQAEFTPRNVQTQETRSTTVYEVEIRLPNPDHALKPGMPADASF